MHDIDCINSTIMVLSERRKLKYRSKKMHTFHGHVLLVAFSISPAGPVNTCILGNRRIAINRNSSAAALVVPPFLRCAIQAHDNSYGTAGHNIGLRRIQKFIPSPGRLRSLCQLSQLQQFVPVDIYDCSCRLRLDTTAVRSAAAIGQGIRRGLLSLRDYCSW